MEHSSERVREACPEQRDQEVGDVSLDSVTLARLLEEVRNGEAIEANAYNRMHNRHNR